MRNSLLMMTWAVLWTCGLLGCSDDSTPNCPEGHVFSGGICVPEGAASGEETAAGGEVSEDAGEGDASGAETGEDVLEESGEEAETGEDVGSEGDDGCLHGTKACGDGNAVLACIDGFWIDSVDCPEGTECANGECVSQGDICVPGTPEGCFSSTSVKTCDENGKGYKPTPCAEGLFCLDGVCGDALCVPGSLACVSINEPGVCAEDGKSFEPSGPCGDNGVCEEGICKSGCSGLVKYGTSYVGCEYWSVDLDQYDDPSGDPINAPYGVVISNPGDVIAHLIFEAGTGIAVTFPDQSVLPGQARQFQLPSLNVDGSGINQKSIRITSDRPITAHQFNPLDNVGVASNDASLLLPAENLGTDYRVMSWPTTPLGNIDFPAPEGCCTDADCPGAEVCCETAFIALTTTCEDACSGFTVPSSCGEGGGGGFGDLESQRGYFTLVASSSGQTSVTVTSTAHTIPGPGVDSMAPGETRTFSLAQFDVLTIQADVTEDAGEGGGLFGLPDMSTLDLTGTLVVADKPIVLWGGHEEAVVGKATSGSSADVETSACCAEHLEEQMFPMSSWGMSYLCVKTRPRGTPSEPDLWRVMAADDNTILSTVPAIEGIHGVTLQAGQWVQAYTTESFELGGTGPLQVAQYTVGQEATAEVTGDPSMILAVPSQRLRESYVLLTPLDYNENYITIYRPVGVEVSLDGSVLDAGLFAPFGTGGWERAWVAVAEGVHVVEGDAAFGLTAYGWNSAVSYGYPGGMSLAAP